MTYLEPLMQQNFIEYASYVIVDRAIPDLFDGCKPVQRRLLYTLFEMDDGKFHKVANVIGETMKLHPHGDASIGNALVVLANKEYFIEKQGNFGNPITGHQAAAPRYIECRLTELARDTLFDRNLMTMVPSYDGRKDEPELLHAKLPVLLMLGIEGIAVGMATKILPHCLKEIWQAQIRFLEGKKTTLVPDFLSGGIMDASGYKDGQGKVRVRAVLDYEEGDKRIVVKEIPAGTTTESLIASIEGAAQKGRVKIASIQDFTTEKVSIELQLPRGVYAEEVVPQLYAYTDCEVSLSSNIVAIENRRPRELTVSEILASLTERLRARIKLELEHALESLIDKQHWMSLEQIFIEEKVYRKLEKATSSDALIDVVHRGMKPFAEHFVRPIVDADLKRLLELRIRRISAFDIDKHRRDIEAIVAAIKKTRRQLKQLDQTTIDYVQGLIDKYGQQYARRTKKRVFDEVDKKSVARQNIRVGFDAKTGFFGTGVRSGDRQLNVSEYDLILAICSDGSFRVMPPVERQLLPAQVLYLEVFDPEAGAEFVVVYRDKDKIAYGKRVLIHKFIRNKEYLLIKDKAGRIDFLSDEENPGRLTLTFSKSARMRQKTADFDLSTLSQTAITARGTRLATKAIVKIAWKAR